MLFLSKANNKGVNVSNGVTTQHNVTIISSFQASYDIVQYTGSAS
jgi:hypothetical protein